MNLITAKNLNIFYDQTHAVKDVSFELNKGDFLCIVGENGSGKSTLVKALLGLTKIASGELIMSDELKVGDFGYLPQVQPNQKDFPASVHEVVKSGCANRHQFLSLFTRSKSPCAISNMEKLDVLHLKNKSFRELSGGQKQRALIARALCASNQLLLLDEPTTGLDPESTARLYELIDRLNKEFGVTIVMITHDIHDGLDSANKVLHLRNETLFYGSLQNYQLSGLYQCHRGGLTHEHH